MEGSTPAAICHTHNLLACYSKYRSLTSTSLSFASRSRRRRSGRIHTCRLHSCTHEILLSILLTSTSLTCSSAHTYFCSWWRGRGRIIDTCRIHTQTVSCKILNKDHLPARVLALTVRLGRGEVERSTPADYTHAHTKYFYQF